LDVAASAAAVRSEAEGEKYASHSIFHYFIVR
jgi:hypothetical protein